MQIIKNPIEQDFYNLCRESKRSIQLCAPFVKEDIIEEIIKNKGDDVELSLVTNIDINNIYRNSLDVFSVKKNCWC